MIGGTIPVAGINPGIGIMPEPTIIREPGEQNRSQGRDRFERRRDDH